MDISNGRGGCGATRGIAARHHDAMKVLIRSSVVIESHSPVDPHKVMVSVSAALLQSVHAAIDPDVERAVWLVFGVGEVGTGS